MLIMDVLHNYVLAWHSDNLVILAIGSLYWCSWFICLSSAMYKKCHLETSHWSNGKSSSLIHIVKFSHDCYTIRQVSGDVIAFTTVGAKAVLMPSDIHPMLQIMTRTFCQTMPCHLAGLFSSLVDC